MITREYIYRFDKIKYNPGKFACTRLSKIMRIPYIEASNNSIIKGLENVTEKIKRNKNLISIFEVLINQICDFKIEIDKFEIKLQEFPTRKYPYVVLLIPLNGVQIKKDGFYPSTDEIDKVFKIMGDILSIRKGCKVKFIK